MLSSSRRQNDGRAPERSSSKPLKSRERDFPSSLSQPATPSPAPLSSSSSTSSASSSVAGVHSRRSHAKKSNATANIGDPEKPTFENAGAIVHTKQAKTIKQNSKWICPKCLGDLNLPPRSDTTGLTTNLELHGDRSREEKNSLKDSLRTVVCAMTSCPAPRYHLACSGIPEGSQIYRHAICNEMMTASSAVNRKHEANDVFDKLHSTSDDAWWGNCSDKCAVINGQKQSLDNDEDWPTSMESFMCPNCDVEGRSRYLLEYFERFHSMKESFYSEYLGKSNVRGDENRLDRADESFESRTGDAFLWHMMQHNWKNYGSNGRMGGKGDKLLDYNPSEINLRTMALVLTFLSKQLRHEQIQQHRRRHKRQKNRFHLDPAYLVGMPIRLFNPIDKSYHSGRVIDFRANAPYEVDQPVTNPVIGELTDAKICSTLYLIRFRHGVEGRKIAVHQWIYLEEHSISIGGSICWAKVRKQSVGSTSLTTNNDVRTHTKNLESDVKFEAREEYMSDYRPVQIVFRSMLEMISVENLNPFRESSCLNVLAMGFGHVLSTVRLTLGNSAANSGNTVPKLTENEIAAKTVAMRPEAIPLTSSNPLWIDRILHRAQLTDSDVAMGLAMAFMEKEEERRVRIWRKLSVSHFSQPSFSNYPPSLKSPPLQNNVSGIKSNKSKSTPPQNKVFVSIDASASKGTPEEVNKT